jgi:hypothetical protein
MIEASGAPTRSVDARSSERRSASARPAMNASAAQADD